MSLWQLQGGTHGINMSIDICIINKWDKFGNFYKFARNKGLVQHKHISLSSQLIKIRTCFAFRNSPRHSEPCHEKIRQSDGHELVV